MRMEGEVGRKRRRRPRSSLVGRGRFSGSLIPTPGFEWFEQSPYLGDPVEGFDFDLDGSPFRYTSADVSQTFFGNTFTPETIGRTSLDFSHEDTAGSITVVLPRTNALASSMISTIFSQNLSLTVYRKHRNDPEVVTIFVGKVVSTTVENSEIRFACVPISQLMRNKVPALVFQSQCNWNLYGTGCTVDRLAFDAAGTAVLSGVLLTSTLFSAQPDGWWTNGWVEVGSEKRFIVRHVGETIEIMAPFANAGGTVSVTVFAGCDRTESVCASKFNNLARHLSFPRIPTRNPYEGSII